MTYFSNLPHAKKLQLIRYSAARVEKAQNAKTRALKSSRATCARLRARYSAARSASDVIIHIPVDIAGTVC